MKPDQSDLGYSERGQRFHKARPIVAGETPTFPCWVFLEGNWYRWHGLPAYIGPGPTHWHADQPEAPTEPPSSSRPANEGGAPHTAEQDFQHYLTYSKQSHLGDPDKAMLRHAFFAAWEPAPLPPPTQEAPQWAEPLSEIRELAKAIRRNLHQDIAENLRDDIWVITAAAHALVILDNVEQLVRFAPSSATNQSTQEGDTCSKFPGCGCLIGCKDPALKATHPQQPSAGQGELRAAVDRAAFKAASVYRTSTPTALYPDAIAQIFMAELELLLARPIPPPPPRTDARTELENLYAWVKQGEYVRDDAPDEIARAIRNRIDQLKVPATGEPPAKEGETFPPAQLLDVHAICDQRDQALKERDAAKAELAEARGKLDFYEQYDHDVAQCAAEAWHDLASFEGEDADAQLIIERAIQRVVGPHKADRVDLRSRLVQLEAAQGGEPKP